MGTASTFLRFVTGSASLALMLIVSGCVGANQFGQVRLNDAVRDEIYHRAETEFARGRFLKPNNDGTAGAAAFTFAPLIIQELDEHSSGDTLAVESNTTIYFLQNKTIIRGWAYDQWTYYWDQRTHARSSIQGIRLTLNSAGQPVIWEALADSTAAEVIFVSQSLDAAAATAFGRPLAGRRYATENVTSKAPDAVVARVIEDGPVPMGPMVYCEAGTGNIRMVLCRCMPAQVKELPEERSYRLEPVSSGRDGEGAGERLLERIRREQRRGMVPADWFDRRRLERKLRLPEGF